MCHLDIQKQVSFKKWCHLYKYFVFMLTQKFSDTLRSMRENFLKHILTYLHFTKYNEISISHSHI